MPHALLMDVLAEYWWVVVVGAGIGYAVDNYAGASWAVGGLLVTFGLDFLFMLQSRSWCPALLNESRSEQSLRCHDVAEEFSELLPYLLLFLGFGWLIGLVVGEIRKPE